MKPTKSQIVRKSFTFALAVFSLGAILVSSFSWLKPRSTVGFNNSDGGVNLDAGAEGAYYGGGNGSSNNPYIISNPNHLYNLAWLQYIGYYNLSDINDANSVDIQQKYFEITDDINMTGITLPPIGTEKYPFYSHIEGHSHVVSNLTVSNDNPKASTNDYGVTKPDNHNIPSIATAPRVVGFFGAVGHIPTEYASNDFSSYVASVSNITLENITIKSKTQETLVGLAAGYIDGQMSGVKVSGNSTLEINGQKTALTSITEKLSDYALVGFSKQQVSSDLYTQKQELSQYYNSGDPTHGGVSWGGSVDIKKYNRWMYKRFLTTGTNNREKSNLSTSEFKTDPSENTDNYHLSIKAKPQVTTPYAKSGYDTYYTYYANPDSFDNPPTGYSLQSASNKVHYTRYEMNSGAYLPLKFAEQDELQWAAPANTNTGYIAGIYTSKYTYSPYFTSSHNDVLQNSISNTHITRKTDNATNHTDFTVNDLKTLEILTYSNTDNGWVLIQDSHNSGHTSTNTSFNGYSKKSTTALGLAKYADSREQLFDYENLASTDKPRISGLRFASDPISSSKCTTIPHATINSQTYQDYKIPSGSIDFNLKEDGYINFFAGTYSSDALSYMSFFSLYVVNRNGSNVSSLQRISKVYNNTQWTSSNSQPRYVYDLINENGSTTTSSGTKGTLVFDTSKTTESFIQNNSSGTNALNNVLFYFEIPVNQGEYAMGMVPFDKTHTSSNTAGASLIYLDIGTNGNADDSIVSAYTKTTTKSGDSHPYGVDFAVASAVGQNPVNVGGVSFCVSIDGSQNGNISFNVTSSSAVSITSSITGKYSYLGTDYSSLSSPPSGKFKITGVSFQEEPISTTEKTKTTYIHCGAHDAIIVEDLIGDAAISYTLNNGSSSLAAIKAAISALNDQTLNDIANLPVAITVTRNASGTATNFDCVPRNLPWTRSPDYYYVTISPSSGLKLNITRTATKYTMSINSSNTNPAQDAYYTPNITFTDNAATYNG